MFDCVDSNDCENTWLANIADCIRQSNDFNSALLDTAEEKALAMRL